MTTDLNIILPEIILAIYAMGVLLVGVNLGRDRMAPLLVWATAGMFLFVATLIGAGGGRNAAFGGLYMDDHFSRYAQVAILISAAAILVIGQDYLKRSNILRFEYPALVTLAVVGMMVMVSAGDLMTLYMGLELQSLALYVIASLQRDSVKSTEAGLKYFVLGALSSGLLLYGASLTYGYAGTTLFSGIMEAAQGQASLGLLFGLVFVMAGLAFKVSAVPFHMWTPDVYEGAPTPITAFFATAPKMAAMALFARVVYDAFGGIVHDWQQIMAMLSVLSMFLGSFAAITQTDFKRLMAYSSISHMGYALMGLAAGSALGIQSMLIYMAIYVTMNIGTFAFILMMRRDGRPVSDLDGLKMYARAQPTRALALLVLMFSLAGVPPFLGFFAKIYVLSAAYEGGLVWLAIAGVISSVISAFYYLRIVYYMYFGEEVDGIQTDRSPVLFAALVITAGMMVFGVINMFGIESLAQAAAATLVR